MFCVHRAFITTITVVYYWSAQFSSVAQSCLTLCDPMNCSMPGLTVHHQLLEFTQTHIHRVGDAIQQCRRPQFNSWVGKILWRRDRLPSLVFLGFPCGSAGKNLPAMWETWVWSLGWEDPLEKGKATHASILAWRIPWTIPMGSQRVRWDQATFTLLLYRCWSDYYWWKEKIISKM